MFYIDFLSDCIFDVCRLFACTPDNDWNPVGLLQRAPPVPSLPQISAERTPQPYLVPAGLEQCVCCGTGAA